MYCIKCGVKLAETQEKCPLCNTVCPPDFVDKAAQPLYPKNNLPKSGSGKKALCGAVIILFFIPLIVCFFADWTTDSALDWFGYVAGALSVAYVTFALPMWFKNPNPVVFVPCDFAAIALYLLYINIALGSGWFLSFGLPIVGGLCLITCCVVTLLRYLRSGRLYIIGGAFMALGAFMPLIEFLIEITFNVAFTGWSVYPLVVMILLGGLLIYLAISPSAREAIERKFFF